MLTLPTTRTHADTKHSRLGGSSILRFASPSTFCFSSPEVVSYFYSGIHFESAAGGSVSSQGITHTLLLCLALSAAAAAQGMPPRPGPPTNSRVAPDDDTQQQRLAQDMARKANEDRQKSLKDDTEKLVKLTAELKEYVDKTDASILSLDVIKKADQIEKLAHSVKEKMKGPN
jgi:hypothetical protein